MIGVKYILHFSFGLQFSSVFVSEIECLVQHFRALCLLLRAVYYVHFLNGLLVFLVLEALFTVRKLPFVSFEIPVFLPACVFCLWYLLLHGKHYFYVA